MRIVYFFLILTIFLQIKVLCQNNFKENPILLENKSSLFYSTYYGGSENETFSTMCIDSIGNIFTAGNTASSNYPIVNSNSKYSGGTDININKFDKDGRLIFSMCVGGTNDDYVQEILCDRENNIWICGETNSNDFPITANAFQKNYKGGTKDGYLIKFDNLGNLLFSTFWGGNEYESFAGMTMDKFDNIWVTGRTWSPDFPTTPTALKPNLSSFYETFLFKVDKNLDLAYCSLFGPKSSDGQTLTLSEAIVTDSEGNVFLAGYSNSGRLPVTTDAYQSINRGSYDGFLAKFDNNANLLYCSYFGGFRQDYPSNITIDVNDNIYIQTITASNDYEVKSDNFKQKFLGDLDIYINKFSNYGNLIWATYVGGTEREGEEYYALGKIYGSIYIKNNELYNYFRTRSSGLYSFDGSYSENLSGNTDAYLSKFDLNCNLLYSTYFGGTDIDIASDFEIDKSGKLLICGWSNSTDIPLKNEIQNKNNGGNDAFLTILSFKMETPEISAINPICEGDNLLLFCNEIPYVKYFWNGPNGFTSNDQNPVIKNAKELNSGIYSLYYEIDGFYSDTLYIDVTVNKNYISPDDGMLVFLGSAERSEDYLKLTNAKALDNGAIWLKKKYSLKNDFVTSFGFHIKNGSNAEVKENSLAGADGFAFVIQNSNNSYLGQKGGDMGYSGIPNSIAIEFDLFQNPYDPNGNHIAVQSMGLKPNIANHLVTASVLGMNENILTIRQNTDYYSKIEYDWENKILNIYLGADSIWGQPVLTLNDIDIPSLLNLEENEFAYIGFTSGTGEAFQEHDIFRWEVPCRNKIVIDDVMSIEILTENLSAYPNPAVDFIEVVIDLPKDETVNLSITDIAGNILKTLLNNEMQSGGTLRIPVKTNDLANGMYFLKMQSASALQIKKIMIIK